MQSKHGPLEKSRVKTMSDTSRPVIKLPIVDMSKTESDRAGLAKIVVDALENIGFLFIDNVEGLDFDRLFQACQWFFSLPPEKKRKLCRKNWVPENPNIYRGYFPVVEGEPSRKEGFEFGRAVSPDDVQVSPENWYYETCPWPEEDGKFPFKEYMTSMYEVMHELAMEILRLTALGLGLPEGAFTYLFDDKPCSTYRILHYPPWNGPPPSNARIEDGKILTTPDHSDSNFLTLLATFNYKGLEIVNSEGNWVAVEPRPKSLVMNIGDLFDRMTGGNKFRATRHRVLDIGVDRFSVPFFLEPSYFSDVGVNLIKKYIGEESHEPEKYGCYMIRVAKYERKYFEYKVLPDFEKVGERLGLVDPVGS
nr:2-oxoglutarate-dependent dioxygenase citB isoform X1 [Crassostrea gigas]